jgi:aspartate/methionine/tyrosine aminotransferase
MTNPGNPDRFRSQKVTDFTESVIRAMTRLATHHGAINLAQGFPDFAAPSELKEAARRAISDDVNQYAVTWGSKRFREAIAAKYSRTYGLETDPDAEITVCCGSTEGMIATLLAVTNPGDEVVIFEPFYENYWPDAKLAGCNHRFVTLHAPNWDFDRDELRRAFSPRTKAVIVNTPNNPTGKVFTREELEYIGSLCIEFDALLITDEIYEHILYGGAQHISPITMPGLRDRCVLVNSMSKTYSVTGWRVGWVIAAPSISESIRKVHDFLTVGAAAPLQEAGVTALSFPESYYQKLARDYEQRREWFLEILAGSGLPCHVPAWAYYVMASIAGFGFKDDLSFVHHLIEKIGVAAVPGSSFFSRGAGRQDLIRFCFCKEYETLKAAGDRLRQLAKPPAA